MQAVNINIESVSPLVLKTVRVIMVMLAIVVLAMVAARLCWLFFNGPDYSGKTLPIKLSNQSMVKANAIDVSMLSRVTPFRVLEESELVGSVQGIEQQNAPETELNLVLNGVRADGRGAGVAFISSGSDPQKRYYTGESILGLRGVKVESIYADGVLLSRDGRIERLSNFHDENIGIQSVNVTEKSSIRQIQTRQEQLLENDKKGNHSSISEQVEEAQEEMLASSRMSRDELEGMLSWARFEPVTVGDIPGVTVFPLSSAMFAKSGLKAQDIVQEIDGIVLNENTDYRDLKVSLEQSVQIEIKLIRKQRPVKLLVSVE